MDKILILILSLFTWQTKNHIFVLGGKGGGGNIVIAYQGWLSTLSDTPHTLALVASYLITPLLWTRNATFHHRFQISEKTLSGAVSCSIG
jgi:hypothetical protein